MRAVFPIFLACGLATMPIEAQATDIGIPAKVSFDVAPYCSIAIGQNLNFGTGSVTMGTPGASGSSTSPFFNGATATGVVFVQCSSGSAYTLYSPASGNEVNATRRLRRGSSSDYLVYNATSKNSSNADSQVPFTQSAASSSGWPWSRTGTGYQESITINGYANAGSANSVRMVGTYSDTLNFTVYY